MHHSVKKTVVVIFNIDHLVSVDPVAVLADQRIAPKRVSTAVILETCATLNRQCSTQKKKNPTAQETNVHEANTLNGNWGP